MKKTLTLFLGAFLLGGILCSDVFATLRLPAHHASPYGQYSSISLQPISSTPQATCNIGTLYLSADDRHLYFCRNDGFDTGFWTTISPLWLQEQNNIFPIDTASSSNLAVGIGTKTPLFRLSIDQDGGIFARGIWGLGADMASDFTSGGYLLWYPKKGAFRAAHTTANINFDMVTGDYSVAFGKAPEPRGLASATLGGENNLSSASWSIILSGYDNTVNAAMGNYSVILGGNTNTANNIFGLIYGQNNTVEHIGSFVMGANHTANALLSSITGGQNNTTGGSHSTIGGGTGNITAGASSMIGSGANNQSNGDYSFVGSGSTNITAGSNAFIGSGATNTNDGDYAVISGGQNQTINTGALYGQIAGGQGNEIEQNTTHSALAGGENNKVLTNTIHSFVAGGSSNTVSDQSVAILSGQNNTVSQNYSVVSGEQNETDHLNSQVGGKNIALVESLTSGNKNTFVWGHNPAPVSFERTSTFIILTGQVGVGTTVIGAANKMKIVGDVYIVGDLEVTGEIETEDLVVESGMDIGGQPVPSDERLKKDVLPLQNCLAKITGIKGYSFSWRTDEFPEMNLQKGRHLGIIAQELEEIYPEFVSVDSKGFKHVDYSLLVVPLIEAMKELDGQFSSVKEETDALNERADALVTLVNSSE